MKNMATLLVLDFINDIVHESGKVPSCVQYVKDKKVIQKANSAIGIARKVKAPIIFVKVGFSPDYSDHPMNSPMFLKARQSNGLKIGEWGTEFHEDLNINSQDFVIIKNRVSPFYKTNLEKLLQSLQVKTVFITGVSTNNAVQAAARDAHDRDYNVVVVDDGCGAGNEQDHQYAIHLMRRFAKIVTIDQLSDDLRVN